MRRRASTALLAEAGSPAIAQPDTPEGRARKAAALQEAEALLSKLSAEQQRMYVVRTTTKWIDEELAKLPPAPKRTSTLPSGEWNGLPPTRPLRT
jgi:hypothetical protein